MDANTYEKRWLTAEKRYKELVEIHRRGTSKNNEYMRCFEIERRRFETDRRFTPKMNDTPIDVVRHREKSMMLHKTWKRYRSLYDILYNRFYMRNMNESKVRNADDEKDINELNRLADFEVIPLMKELIEIVNSTLKDEFKINAYF
jgi:hypothetical protein